MYNFYDLIKSDPKFHRQFQCGESLITLFNCPLESKYSTMWSHHNYFVFVVAGRKIWHTTSGKYDLQKGDCVLVRKGSCIIEQFFDTTFCIILFFVPDEFICETLKARSGQVKNPLKDYQPVISVDTSEILESFFHSMVTYFVRSMDPDPLLLELKFRELILTVADNPKNTELLSYFCALLRGPQSISLQKVMDDNFCYNLKLDQYARLSNRSLSSFKRDFQKQFNMSPGKWLLKKRLDYAMQLLCNLNKTVNETAFESGFENPSHFSSAFKKQFGKAPTIIKKI